MEVLFQILGTATAVFVSLLVFYLQSRKERRTAETARSNAEQAAKNDRENAFNLLQQDHNNLKDQVGKIETDTKTLIGGQGEIKGTLDTLLAFSRPVAAEGAVGTPAEEPAGV